MDKDKKVVFVSHCLLNHNVRSKDRRIRGSSLRDVVDILSSSGVGIVQLPCPHVEHNGGLDWRFKTKSELDKTKYRKACKKVSKDVLKNIEKYMDKGYQVIGILGVELSGTCAVHQVEERSSSKPGKGIMIEELEEMMHKKRFQVPIVGMDLNNTFSSAKKLRNLLGC